MHRTYESDREAGALAALDDWDTGLIHYSSNLTPPKNITEWAQGYLDEAYRLMGGGE